VKSGSVLLLYLVKVYITFKLSFNIGDRFLDGGNTKLPDSIQELVISSNLPYIRYRDHFDRILHNLPTNLKRLSLPSDFKFTKQFILPKTLKDLDYNSSSDSLDHLVVPLYRVFENCILEVESIRDLEWLTDNDKTWISKFNIVGDQSITIPKNLLPPNHLVELVVYNNNVIIEKEALPSSLESVYLFTESRITQGMLPNGLKSFYYQSFQQPLEPGLLPNSIETLIFERFLTQQNIPHGFLPNSLTSLDLVEYDRELELGILPKTLVTLSLPSYNQPFKPNVLPNGLKVLVAPSFKQQELFHQSLPTSLSVLAIESFSGSFTSVGPLDHLRTVRIKTLNQSISTLLSNVLNIYLEFEYYDSLVTLHNTIIEKLKINFIGYSPLSMTLPNFFPASLKHLDISNISIKSYGVINNSCISIISNQEIDHSFIPLSVITINNKKKK